MTDKSFPKNSLAQEEDLDLILASRLFAYNLLKRVFLEEPTKEFLNLLISKGLLEAFPLADSNKEIQAGTAEVAEYLKDSGNITDDLKDDLDTDFCGLFIGPGKPSAPPWESFYLSEKKLLFVSEEATNVRSEYEKYNLRAETLQKEPEDYIAYELDFMHHLCQLTLNYLEKKNSDKVNELLQSQKSFLANHLRKWAPKFCQKITENAQTKFYSGFAKILNEFLEIDFAYLGGYFNK